MENAFTAPEPAGAAENDVAVDLTEAQTLAVAGGLNPQPLPPRSEPRLAF